MGTYRSPDHRAAEADASGDEHQRPVARPPGRVDPDTVIQQIGVVETPARHQSLNVHTGLENASDQPVRGQGLIFDPHAMPGAVRLRSCLTALVCVGLLIGVVVCTQGRRVLALVTDARRHHLALGRLPKSAVFYPSQSSRSTLIQCIPARLHATGLNDEIPGAARAFLATVPRIALGVRRDLPTPAQHLRARDRTIVDLFILPHARIAIRYREDPRTVLTMAIAFDPARQFCQAMQLTGMLPGATAFRIDQRGTVTPATAAVPFFDHGMLRVKAQGHRVQLLQFQVQ